MSDLIELREAMRRFTAERDWEKFHDPKSLVLALVGEIGELAELLQWVPADEAMTAGRSGALHDRLGEEMSDVLLYLVRLADVLDVDLREASVRKMGLNAAKHPADVER